VAVAGSTHGDYLVLNGGATQPITGSGRSLADLEFMYSPSFPSGGAHAPALLSGADLHTGLPVIQRCDARLACSGATTLAGASTFSIPVALLPSTSYASDGVVYAQSGRGIYKSVDGGTSFAPLSVGQPGASATATPMLALAPGYRDAGPVRTAYAAVLQAFISGTTSHSAGGIYRTTDAGATWRPIGSPGPFDQGATAVAVAPDGRIFAGYEGSAGHAGLVCSTDAHTWQAACPAVGGGTAKSGGAAQSCGSTGCSSAAPGTGRQGSAAGADSNAAGQANAARGIGTPRSPSTVAASGGLPRPAIAAIVLAAVLALAGGGLLLRLRRQPQ
jgi:hypothetical protein